MKNIMRGPVKDPREMPKEKDTKEIAAWKVIAFSRRSQDLFQFLVTFSSRIALDSLWERER
jgi:hypothetical protein